MGQQLDGFYCGPAYIEYVVRIHEVPCKIGFDINIRYLSYFLRYLGKVLENSEPPHKIGHKYPCSKAIIHAFREF